MRVLGGGRRLGLWIGSAALLGAVALPASASAATASVSGATFTFSAANGEQNDLTVETDGAVFRVIDDNAPVTAGAGCNQRSAHRVNCQNAGVSLVRAFVRDGEDRVTTLIGTTDATLSGGRGVDLLASSDGDDTLIAGTGGFSNQDVLFGNGGDDTLEASTSSNGGTAMFGGPGDDRLRGGGGSDSLLGDTGADELSGGGGFDSAAWSGSAGVTVTVGFGGADDGEPGEGDEVAGDIEFIGGTNFADVLTGGPSTDFLFGGDGKDQIEGRGGDDVLAGGDAADTILGGDGVDQLSGGRQADDFSGGEGDDLVDFSDHTQAVKVTIDDVANDGGSAGGEKDNVRTDVENVFGTQQNDTLTGSGLANTLTGGAGNDTINGGGGDDELFGDGQFPSATAGNDQLSGDGGDDQLLGGAGADTLAGGGDFDVADYSRHAGATSLTVTIDNLAGDGAAGENDNVTDTVEGVVAGAGDDTITGNSAANVLFGGPGSDQLNGGGGPDLLDGETPGFGGGFGADVFNGGSGVDTVTYASHSFNGVGVDIDGVADDGVTGENDNVTGTVENLIGTNGFDTLTGNSQANTLTGRDGNDSLFGGGGGDSLAGNGGVDLHEGGAGKDEINSRSDNNADTDNCGSEADVAVADVFDTVNADCETRVP